MTNKQVIYIAFCLCILSVISILLFVVPMDNIKSITNNNSVVVEEDETSNNLINNVYISCGSGFDLYDSYSVGVDYNQPILNVLFNKRDALYLFNGNNYSITIYLKGAEVAYFEDYYIITKYNLGDISGETYVPYYLPDEFALPEINSWNLTGVYHYYVLVEIVDNNSGIKYTSNLLTDSDFSCGVAEAGSGYRMSSLCVTLNSDLFTESGELHPTTDCLDNLKNYNLSVDSVYTTSQSNVLQINFDTNLFRYVHLGKVNLTINLTLLRADLSIVEIQSFVLTEISSNSGLTYYYSLPDDMPMPTFIVDNLGNGDHDVYYYSINVDITSVDSGNSINISSASEVKCMYYSVTDTYNFSIISLGGVV